MKLKTLLLLAVALFVPASSFAGATLWNADDVPSTSYTYCAYSTPRQGQGFIQTSGASTTVTAVSGTPFAQIAVGDEIMVIPGPPASTAADIRRVTAVGSSTSITINSSATWTAGYAFQWRHWACGTTSAAGGVDVTDSGPKIVQLVVTTLNATSVTASVEGRIAPSATWSAVGAAVAFTTTGSSFVEIPEGLSAVRVGWKLSGDGGVQSVSSYLGTSPRGLALEVTGYLPRFTTAALPTCSATQNYLRQVADITTEELKFCDGSSWSVLAGSAGITNSAGANVIPKSDGTNLVASSISAVNDVTDTTYGLIASSTDSGAICTRAGSTSAMFSLPYSCWYGGNNGNAAFSDLEVSGNTSANLDAGTEPFQVAGVDLSAGDLHAAATSQLYAQGFSITNRGSSLSTPAFTGSGLDDAYSAGAYQGTNKDDVTYTVIIDATGTPDTFKWKKGTGIFTTGVAITGIGQTLADNVKITFGATTGHTLNDQWIITATPGRADIGTNAKVFADGTITAAQFGASRNAVSASAHAAACDFSLGANCAVTLQGGGADTLTLSHAVSGGHYTFELIQPSGSDGTVTWPAAVHWPGGVAPTLTTTDAQVDVVACYYNGTSYFCDASLNFAP